MGNIYKILSSFVPFLPKDFTSCVILMILQSTFSLGTAHPATWLGARWG